MNRNKILSTALVLVLGLSAGLASAQPHDRRDGGRHGPSTSSHRDAAPSPRATPPHEAHRHPHRVGGPAHAHGRQEARYDHRHGARPDYRHPRYHRGDRLPSAQRYHVVNDWRARRLSPPSRGHQWVQVSGGELALVAIATGLIAHIVINR
jgi:Ni/Co efflux regulator RcnB